MNDRLVATRPDRADYRARLFEKYISTFSGTAPPVSPEGLRAAAVRYRVQLGRFLPVERGAAILEVGCGPGRLLWFLRQQGYTQVRGIDFSSEQVSRAKALGLAGIEQAEAHDYLRAHPAEFNLIFAIDVLAHLTKSEVLDFLDAAHDALKPGGQIVLQTVNGAGPFGGTYLYGDFVNETAFSAWSIAQVLRACGFDQIVVSEVQPVPHGLVSRLRKVLWMAIRTLLIGYLAVETGTLRGHVLTLNLTAAARRAA